MHAARPRRAARLVLVIAFAGLLATRPWTAGFAFAQGGCEAATITSPRAGDTLRGAVDVLGSASIDGFNFYKVEWATAQDPEQWIAVSEVIAQPVRNGRLDAWSTDPLAEGRYRLKLTVVDETFGERCRFLIDDLGVANDTAPTSPAASARSAFPTAVASVAPVASEGEGIPSSNEGKLEGAEAEGVVDGGVVDGGVVDEVAVAESQTEEVEDLPIPTASATPRATLEPVLPQPAATSTALPAGMGRTFAIGLLLAVLAGLGLAVLLLRR